MNSPTSRSLAELKRLGYTAAVVERWNPYARIRQDLFGFIDVLAVNGHVLAVQACAGASHAARATKVREQPNLPAVLSAGVIVEVWSWSKRGAAGKRKLWTLRRERIEP